MRDRYKGRDLFWGILDRKEILKGRIGVMNELIYCSQKEAEHPYYVEELGVRIFSGEELSYIIYNHFLDIDERFLCENLVVFIGNELGYHDLAGRLWNRIKDPSGRNEILLEILKEIGYYTAPEINGWKEKIEKLENAHPAQVLLVKADYYAERKRYNRALKYYYEIFETYEEQINDKQFLGEAWCRMGNTYARLFDFEKAFEAYGKGYGYLNKQEQLKKMYYLTLLQPSLKGKNEIFTNLSSEEQHKCEERLEDAKMEAAAGEPMEHLRELFQREPYRRKEGIRGVLTQWKEEYRRMV